MWKKTVLISVLTVSIGSVAGVVSAAGGSGVNAHSGPVSHEKGTMMQQDRMDRDGKPVAGYNMMTEQEREEYRNRLNSMNSSEQRQAYREEHRQMMEERAQAQSKKLEDLPPTAAGKPESGYDDGTMKDKDKGMQTEGDKNMGMHKDEDSDTEND